MVMRTGVMHGYLLQMSFSKKDLLNVILLGAATLDLSVHHSTHSQTSLMGAYIHFDKTILAWCSAYN
jgi:hypothetical protein